MTHPAIIERITRSLAYMLRHQPEEFELELDSQGFGRIEEVVRALNEKLGEPVEPADIEAAIASGDRPRYEIVDDRVRALYGHSIDVEPGESSKPPQLLYVGLSSRDAKRAVQYGLRGGRRRFLHLALTIDDARETGRRAGREYSILTVHALEAWEDGVNFFDRQTLFLAEQIPTDFLEITETRDDGIERFDGNGRGRGRGSDRARSDRGSEGGSGGRGAPGGRRESGRGRGGDRDGDRGRTRAPSDRDRGAGPGRSDRGEGRPRRERERQPERGRERERERERQPGRERQPERPRSEPERKPTPAPARRGPSFGTGILDEPAADSAREAPEKRSRIRELEPRPAPPETVAAPPREPAPPVEKAADDSSGFGAGL